MGYFLWGDEKYIGVCADAWIRKPSQSQARPVGSTDKGGVFQVEWNGGSPRVQGPPLHGESIFIQKRTGLDAGHNNGMGETIRPPKMSLNSQCLNTGPGLSHMAA